MKKYIVYNDTHAGGGHDSKIEIPLSPADNLILNGDIIDLSGCAKKDVSKYLTLYGELRYSHGRRMIRGNHECSASGADMFIDDTVLFAHGHIQMWKEKKVIKWQNKSMGSSWFKRKLLVPLWDKLRHFRKYRIKRRFKDNIYALKHTHHGVTTMVFGHAHPNKIIDTKIYGVRILVLPRGRNEIFV